MYNLLGVCIYRIADIFTGENVRLCLKDCIAQIFRRKYFRPCLGRAKIVWAKFNLLTLILITYKIAWIGCVAVDRCDKRMETVEIEKECCVHGFHV